MGIFKSFEEMVVWQESKILTEDCYAIFKYCKDYSFKDQILRASLSIMNNIAEGYERKSNKDFCRFLFIAKGSCGEVRSMTHIAVSLGYLEQSQYNVIFEKSILVSRMLSSLIKTLKTNEFLDKPET